VLVEFCRQLLICRVVVLPSSFLGVVAAQGAYVLVNKGYGFKVLWVQVLQARHAITLSVKVVIFLTLGVLLGIDSSRVRVVVHRMIIKLPLGLIVCAGY
jgi:hypothetical protein